jgi:hypothetical protein
VKKSSQTAMNFAYSIADDTDHTERAVAASYFVFYFIRDIRVIRG